MAKNFASKAKKIAAIGAGLFMLGATCMSAVSAATLADYPSPFVSGGKFQSVALVVGANAKSEDNLALTDISIKLQSEATGGSGSSGGSVTSSDSEFADIPLGVALASTTGNEFETSLENDDLDFLFDGSISYRSSDYDVKEMFLISAQGALNNNTLSPQTSLTSSDDDYETNVLLEVRSGALKYFYFFDETINFSAADSSNSLDISFLGKPLKITNVNSAGNKFTATVGDEYWVKVDESVDVLGKTVTLLEVGSSGTVQIDVDGKTDQISSGSTETVNGVEIKNQDYFYDSNDRSLRSATLIMGDDATETYQDGDGYLGEDEGSPDWTWVISGLYSGGTSSIVNNASGITTSGVVLGITNEFTKDDDSDDPVNVGECYSLPNDFISICFDGLSIPDEDYMTLTMELKKGVSFKEAGFPDRTSADTVLIESSESEGLVLDQSDLNWSNGTSADRKTNKIWIYNPGANANLEIYYEDTNGKTQLAGNLTNGNYTAPGSDTKVFPFAHIDYGDVSGTDMILTAYGGGLVTSNLTITVVPYDATDLSDYNDNVSAIFRSSSGTSFTSLGTNADSEDADELRWQNGALTGWKYIGTKNEDHRTKYGIIIRDPSTKGNSDEVVLEIPKDIVLAEVTISGSATAITAGTTGPSSQRIAPDAMLDTTLTNPAAYNVITVGGPCVNKVTADLMDLTFPACGASSTIDEDTAVIELRQNNGKIALVVAGWEAEDTQRAGLVLKNYKNYFDSTTGTSVKVTGIGLTDINVA